MLKAHKDSQVPSTPKYCNTSATETGGVHSVSGPRSDVYCSSNAYAASGDPCRSQTDQSWCCRLCCDHKWVSRGAEILLKRYFIPKQGGKMNDNAENQETERAQLMSGTLTNWQTICSRFLNLIDRLPRKAKYQGIGIQSLKIIFLSQPWLSSVRLCLLPDIL